MKGLRLAVLAAACLLMLAGTAAAHAVVYPKTVAAGAYEKFTLRVPNEKEAATVKVVLEIPAGFEVSRVRPVPGWSYAMEMNADGKTAKSITFDQGKILAGEFQEFELNGKTGSEPGNYAWKVLQTYADGETVAWTGPSDAKTPASIMVVEKAAQPAAAASLPLSTVAAYGGLVLGAASLLLALRRK